MVGDGILGFVVEIPLVDSPPHRTALLAKGLRAATAEVHILVCF